MRRKIFLPQLVRALAVLAVFPLPRTLAMDNQKTIRIKIVVFTESDGTNAAASMKHIDEQITRLRADAARVGLNVQLRATSFVADSRRLHFAAASRAKQQSSRDYPGSQDDLVIYVVRMVKELREQAFHIAGRPADGDRQPVIVIDRIYFGAHECGETRDKPCYALTEAVGAALAENVEDEAVKQAAQRMKQEAARKNSVEPAYQSKQLGE